MMHDMMQRQWTSGHKVVHLAPSKVGRATAPPKPKALRGNPLQSADLDSRLLAQAGGAKLRLRGISQAGPPAAWVPSE